MVDWQVFPQLEKLRVDEKEFMVMWQAAQFSECLYPELRVVEIVSFHNVEVYPLGDVMQKFQNLVKLKVNGRLEEVSITEMNGIDLQYIGDLKYLYEHDSQLDFNFEKFKILRIENRCSLINLMHSFRNLKILIIRDCESLETIVTSSMAKSMAELEVMSITDCPKITEVIRNEDEVSEDRIVFRKLKILSLQRMENLKSFCSCNLPLEFPSLKELYLMDCQTMKTFCQGDYSAMPRLQTLKIGVAFNEPARESSFETFIRNFHETVVKIDFSLTLYFLLF